MRVIEKLLAAALIGLLIAACSSTPGSEAVASVPNSGTQVVAVNKLTAEQIVGLQRQGYMLVNGSGQTLYCRTNLKTGSHLQHDSTCLTEREMVALREQTQRGLENTMMQVPPKQGK